MSINTGKSYNRQLIFILILLYISPLISLSNDTTYIQTGKGSDFPFLHPVFDKKFKGNYAIGPPISCDIFANVFSYTGLLNIHDVTFSKTFNLLKGNFYGILKFQQDTFIHPVFIGSSTFHDYTDFRGCVYYKDVTFVSNTFMDEILFSGSTFFSYVKFDRSTFSQRCDLTNCSFYKGASFQADTFCHEINFSNSKFYNKIDFSHLTILNSSKLIFNNTSLPDSIDFSFINNRTNNIIDLSSINDISKNFNTYLKIHFINLYESDISKFYFPYTNFKLWFPEKCSDEEKNKIYRFLLDNTYKSLPESHKILDIEYQQFINPRLYIFYLLRDYYGYHKFIVLLWMIGSFILFTVVIFFNYEKINSRVYKTKITVDAWRSPHHKWIASLLYMIYFVLNWKKLLEINFNSGWTIFILFATSFEIYCMGYLTIWLFS